MQLNTNNDNPINSGESSIGDLVKNSGTKRCREESPIGDKGDKSIQVKTHKDSTYVSLKFDLNKLSPFTEDNTIECKNYLEVICTEVRVAYIENFGLDMVEKATMNNIYIDYDDPIEREAHLGTLCSAIKQATSKDIDFGNFFFTK